MRRRELLKRGVSAICLVVLAPLVAFATGRTKPRAASKPEGYAGWWSVNVWPAYLNAKNHDDRGKPDTITLS